MDSNSNRKTQIVNYFLVTIICVAIYPFSCCLFEPLNFNGFLTMLGVIFNLMMLVGFFVLIGILIFFNLKEEIVKKEIIETFLLIGIVILAFTYIFPPILVVLQASLTTYFEISENFTWFITIIQLISVLFLSVSWIICYKENYGAKEPKLE